MAIVAELPDPMISRATARPLMPLSVIIAGILTVSVTSDRKRPKGKPQHLCDTPFCRNPKPPQRHRCHKCRKRLWRERHPIHYLYDNLRTSARVRNKGFELTLAEFEEFCLRTGYHLKKGISGTALTVDRIHNDQPYRADNIQALTHEENTAKADNPF